MPQLPCDKQDLDIEHVSVDLLALKQLFGDHPLKELEPALSVDDVVQAHARMHEEAEAL